MEQVILLLILQLFKCLEDSKAIRDLKNAPFFHHWTDDIPQDYSDSCFQLALLFCSLSVLFANLIPCCNYKT